MLFTLYIMYGTQELIARLFHPVFVLLIAEPSLAEPKAPYSYKSDWGKRWQDCSSNRGFIGRHTFKIAATTSARRLLLHVHQHPPAAR